MLKVQNSFNENNINKSSFSNKTKPVLGFTGHKVVQDDQGESSYRFYLPEGFEFGKNAEIELARLEKDKKTGGYKNELKILKEPYVELAGKNFVQYNFTDLGVSSDDPDFAIAYRFKINGKPYLDSTLMTPDMKWNIATPPSRPILEEARSMYHLMPDLMISKKKEKENPALYDARRTHFNKLGGNIDGIIEKIDYISELGAKRILSTPIFGQDNLSSHGYWTTNPYQITDSLGDISRFKKLNTELFKKGMGWIADGAFVNESPVGIHIESLIKWGDQSPYKDWFKTFNFSNKPLEFGILPKKEGLFDKHVGIRLVNAKYKITFDDKGNESSVEENKKYNPDQPTYVQIFDKRLASKKQINSDEIFTDYENKNPKDHNEINDYMDSVVPYYFKISQQKDVLKDNYKNWQDSLKTGEKRQFKEFLTNWKNFSIVSSQEDGGVETWVGNKDIPKLHFIFTPQEQDQIKNKEKKENIKHAVNQVQDNIVQVGQFWTNEVAKTLHIHTAKQLAGATDAESYLKKIKFNVADKQLPAASLKVTKSQIENLLKGENNYTLKTAPAPENITDGLMSYPLDAIEFNSGMSSILGSPYIKKLAINEDQIAKTRYEIFKEEEAKPEKDRYQGAVLDNFKPTYQKMDNLISNEMTSTAVEILKKVDEKRPEDKKILTKDGKLTDDGKELYGLISNDMAKFIYVSALAPDIKPIYRKDNDTLEYDNKKLAGVTPESLGIHGTNPANEADLAITKLQKGIEAISKEDKEAFAEHLANRLEGLDGAAVKVAKLVVDKAEGGLEWRVDASKDVCPIETIKEGDNKAYFESNWDEGIKFWNKFTDGVRKYNPKAYEILEVTDEADLVKANPEENRIKYQDAHESMLKFIQGAGATTPTNYNFLYSWPHELYGSNTENWSHSNDIGSITQKLIHGWCKDDDKFKHCFGLLLSGSLDTVNQSHNSLGNHDKPRALHGFGLDMKIFHQKPEDLIAWANNTEEGLIEAAAEEKEKKTGEKERYAEAALKVKDNMEFFYGENPDVNKIDGKAFAMGIAIKESLEDADAFKKLDSEHQKDIKQALVNLTQGKYTKEDGTEGKYEPQYFGVRPFDRNISDIITEAKRISKSGFDKVSDNDASIKDLKNEALSKMLAPAMKKYRAAMGLLAAMPGNPTIYAGDELGETGFEYKFKNTFVQNRNFNHYSRLKEGTSDYIGEIETKKKEIAKLMNLRKKEALSPLVNGSTVVLDTKDAKVAGIYRYNDEKDMIVLFNKEGFGMGRAQAGLKEGEKVSVEHIDLSSEFQLNEKGNDSESKSGILSNLKEGTVYKNALDENDNSTYQIKDYCGKKLLKRYDKNNNPVDIVMKGTDLFLYRTKNFDEKTENKVSFSGNSLKKNPQVAIANMKFGIPVAKESMQLNKTQIITKAFV